MKDLKKWLHAHPVKACAFTCYWSVLTTWLAFRSDTLLECAALYLPSFAILAFVFWQDFRRFALTAAIAFALLSPATTNAEPDVEPVPPLIAGGAVVGYTVGCAVSIVGIVCTYKFIKFCQKQFPIGTNTSQVFNPAHASTYGAAWLYEPMGSCTFDLAAKPPTEPPAPPATVVTLDIAAASPDSVTTHLSLQRNAPTQTFAEFQAELLRDGLRLNSYPTTSPSLSRTGQPCSEAESIFTFNPIDHTATVNSGYDAIHLVIDTSVDLQQWYRVLSVEVPAGSTIQLTDATISEAHRFYRVSAGQP